MDKYEALEFIANRLIEVDVMLMKDDELTDDSPTLNEKWLLLEAQSRVLAGDDPMLTLKNVLEI